MVRRILNHQKEKANYLYRCERYYDRVRTKKIIEGILKIPPSNQQLFNKDNTVMEDSHMLQDYGLNSNTAKAQSPAMVGLAIRDDNGTFEILDLVPYSAPPDLPDVMKSQESNGQEQAN